MRRWLRGVSIITKEEKIGIRRYLLGQLEEAEQERLELRLLTDPVFAEEFDTVVDEIADQYAGNEIGPEERKRVEQYFLTSSERQQKVQFAEELMERAAAERGSRRVAVAAEPGILARLLAFWTKQSFSFRTATTVATIVIAIGLVFLIPRNPGSGSYQAIKLPISKADRATGSETKTVQLNPGDAGVRIELTLPEQYREAKSYRVELVDEQERSRDLAVTERNSQSLTIMIPANEITRGSYIIKLYADRQRVPGSCSFTVL